MKSKNLLYSGLLISMTLLNACQPKKEEEAVQPPVLPTIQLTEQDQAFDVNFSVIDGKDWKVTFDESGKEVITAEMKDALENLKPKDAVCTQLTNPSVMVQPSQAFDPGFLKLPQPKRMARLERQTDKTTRGVFDLEVRHETTIFNEAGGRFQINLQINRANLVPLTGTVDLLKTGIMLPQGTSLFGDYQWQNVQDQFVYLKKNMPDAEVEFSRMANDVFADPTLIVYMQSTDGNVRSADLETTGIKFMKRISGAAKKERIARGFYNLTGHAKFFDAILEQKGLEEWEATFTTGEVRNIFIRETVIKTNKVVGETVMDYCNLVEVSRERIYFYKETLQPFAKTSKKMLQGQLR